MKPKTEAENGSGDQNAAPASNPEWDAMNGVLKKALSITKEEFDRREALYKASRQGKKGGQRNPIPGPLVN